MFEEINNLRPMCADFLKRESVSIKSLFELCNFGFLKKNSAQDYLATLVNDKTVEENQIVELLITDDHIDFMEKLSITSLNTPYNTKVANETIMIILKWLIYTKNLPKDMDLVELCYDLITYYKFPDLENKQLNCSLSDYALMENQIYEYLKLDK